MAQGQLAEKSGVTAKHTSNIECSISFPSATVISALALALSIPEYKLFVPEDIKKEHFDDTYISKVVLRREVNKLVKNLLNECN